MRKKNILYTKLLRVFFVLFVISGQAFCQEIDMHQNKSEATFYVFLNQDHTFLLSGEDFISTNYIKYDGFFDNKNTFSITGSEALCQNLFYFNKDKIIFYNPSKYLTTYMKCRVEISNAFSSNISVYNFVFNKTFESWCTEKSNDTAISHTVSAILAFFDSKTCSSETMNTINKARMISLSHQKIEDLSPLSSLVHLRSLWLDNNSIDDTTPLSSLYKLVFLSLNNNMINNADSLSILTNLKWVFLNNNQISNIDFLKNLNHLKFVSLNKNLLTNMETLENIPKFSHYIAKDNPFYVNTKNKHTSNMKDTRISIK